MKQKDIKYPNRAQAYPFVKWAGGKRMVVPDILQVLPESFNAYYEPFVGGGAVFFALNSRIGKAYLSDSNQQLMLTYKIIQTEPRTLIKRLKTHARHHSKEHYYKVRNNHNETDAVKLAARFIYLNRTCYNGLYRVNKAGHFNAPMGSYKNPTVCDEKNLLATSEVLQKATLRTQSFECIEPKEDDLIYCDPPYHSCFTSYTADGFTEDDQKGLRYACDRWRDKGSYIIVSNADTSFTRRIWKGYHFERVKVPRNINSNGSGRAPVPELLILS